LGGLLRGLAPGFGALEINTIPHVQCNFIIALRRILQFEEWPISNRFKGVQRGITSPAFDPFQRSLDELRGCTNGAVIAAPHLA
jgi:hypothetical protein